MIKGLALKSQNARYFQYVFGTYDVNEENKEEIINRINTPLSPEDRLALQCYIAELLDKVRCGLGLESTGRHPKETDNEVIPELEKLHETLSEIYRRTKSEST
ncbi:MAG: hypothetical protein E4H14_11345 [Candidatus Thorarchaeota archaeon]|nr:MAG: hypothetical protein E4H14_11345 [Candidatus Thorarchaeota archaeon]